MVLKLFGIVARSGCVFCRSVAGDEVLEHLQNAIQTCLNRVLAYSRQHLDQLMSLLYCSNMFRTCSKHVSIVFGPTVFHTFTKLSYLGRLRKCGIYDERIWGGVIGDLGVQRMPSPSLHRGLLRISTIPLCRYVPSVPILHAKQRKIQFRDTRGTAVIHRKRKMHTHQTHLPSSRKACLEKKSHIESQSMLQINA